MAKDREAVTCNGRAAFYAAMWDDIRQCAMDCGWAVALHGSLAADMDIMAMPWTEDAVSFYELCRQIKVLFKNNEFDWDIDYHSKPNKRIVATIPIWADFYLDISTLTWSCEVCAAKVAHGRWEVMEPKRYPNQTARIRCSVCKKEPRKHSYEERGHGYSFNVDSWDATDFCPNCGANLKGDC